jgi:hypothetical protein
MMCYLFYGATAPTNGFEPVSTPNNVTTFSGIDAGLPMFEYSGVN